MTTTTNRPANRPDTPTPQPPARPAESAASAASRVAPLDLTSLAKPSAVARPKREYSGTGGPGRTPRDNSLVEGWVRELDGTRKGAEVSPDARALPLTAGGLGELRTRLIQAAGKVGCGIGMALDDEKALKTKLKITGPVTRSKLLNAVTKSAKENGPVKATDKVTLLFWTQKRKAKPAAKSTSDVASA